MNRPDKLNALSGELVEALRASFRRAAADDEVKVVVLTGAGRAFSAGFDISEEVASEIAGAERWHDLLSTDVSLGMELWSLPRPTIAAVRGWCLAGALRARDGLRHDRRGRRRPLRRARDPLRVGAGLAADAVRARPEEDQRAALHGRLGRRGRGRAPRARQPRRAGRRARGRGRRARRQDRADAAARAAPDQARAQSRLRGHGAAAGRQRQPRPLRDPQRGRDARAARVRRIVAAQGLKAALAWRDSRYGSPDGASPARRSRPSSPRCSSASASTASRSRSCGRA